ncbi:hypothetical protein C8R47DRAFT_247629 [Mycena vitilis]|nr:hypothetical protein C8R47DRAFT_247629 [Mycena vitilis]
MRRHPGSRSRCARTIVLLFSPTKSAVLFPLPKSAGIKWYYGPGATSPDIRAARRATLKKLRAIIREAIIREAESKVRNNLFVVPDFPSTVG